MNQTQLLFITGNTKKFTEVSAILNSFTIVQQDIDLAEIQELDAQAIIKEKLLEARKLNLTHCFCEDVSLEIECLNGFPGPLIKWFLKTNSVAQIYELLQHQENKNATAVCHIGYFDGEKNHFFKGEVKGTLVAPTVENGFGFDPLFLPDGETLTYAQMSSEQKNKISHRFKAYKLFKEFLIKEKSLD